MAPRILFVSGFHPKTRARDLAYEFERFGPLVRCDVPAPRGGRVHANPYAFVEFRSSRDAESAYYDMHGRNFEGLRLSIQWAKNPPSSVWRFDRSPPRRRRSRSPRRRRSRSRDRDDEKRSSRRSRSRSRSRDRDEKDKERKRRSRSRSRSGERGRKRTPSADAEHKGDENGAPLNGDDAKREDSARPQSPQAYEN